MIVAEKLGKEFRGHKRTRIRAVDAVSFRCEPGRAHGLFGANGAGKTTTLRLLATILTPTSGTAIVAGHDILHDSQNVRAHVGFLSTATALYARLTAQEMVEYFGRLEGLDENALRQRVDALFDRLKMNEFRHRRCDKLSTGMKQRVSIARTLIHDPPKPWRSSTSPPPDSMSSPPVPSSASFANAAPYVGKTALFSTRRR